MTPSPETKSDGRRAVVTGAARGIGRAVVERLLHDGYEVWCWDIDGAGLSTMHAALAPNVRDRAHTVVADVADEAAVAAGAARLPDGAGLDVLVNNAGLAEPVSGPIESLALDDWERVLRVNLTGCFLVAKHVVPALRARRGCIVNMTSTRAFQSEAESEAYAASKGGIHALTHALAISLGPAVRVNAIAPGWIDVRQNPAHGEPLPVLREIDHAQHPAGRVGRGADIAALVAFLAGDEAGFITGQTLVADGGMTRRMIYAH